MAYHPEHEHELLEAAAEGLLSGVIAPDYTRGRNGPYVAGGKRETHENIRDIAMDFFEAVMTDPLLSNHPIYINYKPLVANDGIDWLRGETPDGQNGVTNYINSLSEDTVSAFTEADGSLDMVGVSEHAIGGEVKINENGLYVNEHGEILNGHQAATFMDQAGKTLDTQGLHPDQLAQMDETFNGQRRQLSTHLDAHKNGTLRHENLDDRTDQQVTKRYFDAVKETDEAQQTVQDIIETDPNLSSQFAGVSELLDAEQAGVDKIEKQAAKDLKERGLDAVNDVGPEIVFDVLTDRIGEVKERQLTIAQQQNVTSLDNVDPREIKSAFRNGADPISPPDSIPGTVIKKTTNAPIPERQAELNGTAGPR